jgi:hypothetical protein
MLEDIRDILRRELVGEGFHDDVIFLNERANRTEEPSLAVKLQKRRPALLLKLDEQPSGRAGAANEWLFPLFDATKPGLTNMCDYIVFYEAPKRGDARLFTFLCELKSGNLTGAARQIRNGKIMSELIIEMARHNQAKMQQPWAVEYRGLVFSTKTLSPKGSFSPNRTPFYERDPRMPSLARADFARGIELPLDWLCA